MQFPLFLQGCLEQGVYSKKIIKEIYIIVVTRENPEKMYQLECMKFSSKKKTSREIILLLISIPLLLTFISTFGSTELLIIITIF